MCDADHLHKVKTEEMVPIGSTQPPDSVSCRAPRSPQAAEIDALSDALIESWSPKADVGPAAGPRRRRAGTPHEAIKAAELLGGKWLPQPAGPGDVPGRAPGGRGGDGTAVGRGRPAAHGTCHTELEERRCGPGGRARLADPRPGDFPGRGARPQAKPETEMEAG